MHAVCKVKVGPPWNQAVWHEERTLRKFLILKLAFILKVEGTPVFVIDHSSNLAAAGLFLVSFVFSAEYVAPVSTVIQLACSPQLIVAKAPAGKY